MADISILQLPPTDYVQAQDVTVVVQNGITKKVAASVFQGGIVGPTGPAGPQGPQGVAGPVGPAGADGARGPSGPEGPMGPSGPRGAPGPVGDQGPIGPTGATGPTGPEGPRGPAGAQGDPGAAATIEVGTTSTVPPGDLATVVNVGTSQAAIFDFGIPQGEIGPAGPVGPGVAAGGLTGQVLAKLSNTNYDTTWINLAGGLNYQGSWDASTNTPTLTSSVGTNGFYYIVSVAGTTNLNGITDWQIGDWAIFNGTVWQKVDQSNLVDSVNGQVGTVVLTYSDVGAPSTTGTDATGTWDIDISGNAGNVSGIVEVANGGTGRDTFADGRILYGGLTYPINTSDNLFFDGYNLGVGTLTPNAYAGYTTLTLGGTSSTSTGELDLVTGDGLAHSEFYKQGDDLVLDNYGVGAANITINPIGGLTILSGDGAKVIGTLQTDSLTGYLFGNGSTGVVTASTTIPNSGLANSSITINGSSISLGGSATITAVNPFALTIGSGLGGTSYDGSSAVTITNTAPDQIVSLTGAGTTTVTGTYPNFTITSSDAYTGTVTSVGTGTGLSGGPITTTGTISFSNSAVGTWAATPSSANLAAAMTDETGSGSLVFANSPTLSGVTIDGSNPYIQFNNGSAVTLAAGKMWYDGSTGSLNFGMGGGNITQQVGEELLVYGKASAAINDSPLQIVYQTGTVGASGVITFAPTVAGITDGNKIIGVATEPIANNAFGRINAWGIVHGITTNGTAYGEVWADNDEIWYNPVTGNPTNVKPSAPNIKVSLGTVIKAGSGGSGSFNVEISHGSVLGGTDSNVQLSTPSNGQILTYDGSATYWRNTSLTAGSGISVSAASNGVLTITNTSPSSGGTVTSVSGIGTVSGLTLTGTVTTSGSLTLGGTLDLSSPPAIGGTTPNTGKFTTVTATSGIYGGAF